MKTKLILFAIGATIMVYSCATDRDEINPSDNIQKNELLIKKTQFKTEQVNKSSDTLISPLRAAHMSGLENEIIDPTKPDKPW